MSDQSRHITTPSHAATLCGLTCDAVALRGETIVHQDFANCSACITVRSVLSKQGARRVKENAKASAVVRAELRRLGHPGHE